MTDVPAATVTPMMAPAPGQPVPSVGNTAPVSASIPPAPVAPVVEPVKASPAADAVAPAAIAPKRLIVDEPVKADIAKTEPAKEVAKEAPKVAEWKLEIPKDSLVSQGEVTALEAKAKTLGISQENAQAILLHRTEQVKAEIQRTNDLWYDQSMADPEIGGAKMPVTQANVQKALAAYATADERKAIASSPFANNPLFLRILNRAAAGLPSEDRVHVSQALTQSEYPTDPTSAAQYMYGRTKR